jgi:hypothetical protein
MKLPMLCLLLASSCGIALAQASTPDSIDPWLKAGVAICSLTALIWVVQHLLRNTIPKQQETFTQTLDKISEKSERHDEQFCKTIAEQAKSCDEIQRRWTDKLGEKN